MTVEHKTQTTDLCKKKKKGVKVLRTSWLPLATFIFESILEKCHQVLA